MLKKSITVFWAGAFGCSLILLVMSIYAGYPGFIAMVLRSIGQQQHLEIALSFVSKTEYRLLQAVIVIWMALLLLAWIFRFQWHSQAAAFLRFLSLSFQQLWHEITSSRAKYFLLIPLASALWHAIHMPVTYDEAWTYVHLTTNGPLVSATFYPAPNNHILFSLISNLTRYLPFVPPLLAFRISSIMITLLSLSLLWYALKKRSSEQTAGLIVALVSVLFMTMYYSYMGRGYALVTFFFILSAIAAAKLSSGKSAPHFAILYVLANVLGGYTMPSFIYATSSIACALLLFRPGDFRRWAKIHVIILFAWLVLYLPVFIVNGIGAITHNAWVQSIPFDAFLRKIGPFLYHALHEITGLPAGLWCILLLASFLYLFWRKQWKMLTGALILLAIPVLLMTWQSVIPFPRTLVWMTIVIPVVILMPFDKIWSAVPIPWLYVSAILLQLGLAWTMHGKCITYDSVYKDYHDLAIKIAGDRKSYYFNSWLFDTTFAFEMQTRGYTFGKVSNFYPTRVHPMNADTIEGYDFIIIDKGFDETRLKKPIHVSRQINVYQ